MVAWPELKKTATAYALQRSGFSLITVRHLTRAQHTATPSAHEVARRQQARAKRAAAMRRTAAEMVKL